MTSLLRHLAVLSKSRLLWLMLVAISLVLALSCHGGSATVFSELESARRLAADLRVQFNKAADASNRAVMADTDEASIAFAHDAEQTSRLVENDVAALGPLLRRLGFPKEIQLLDQFEQHFLEYQNLDRRILALAVENTNLKAQRLSFGPARKAADSLRDSLATVALAVAPRERCRADGLVAKAVLAVREVQVLQASHIAESDDAAMTRLEQEIGSLDATASSALGELARLVEPGGRPALAAAQAALDQFRGVSGEIRSLSRRNSNVLSLDLSLRAKPSLTGACDDSLHALVEALAAARFKATR